jgi:hypothetical protein
MMKIWYIYVVEYYSAINKNRIVTFAGKWMELEIIMLSEIKQAKKDKRIRFLSFVESKFYKKT